MPKKATSKSTRAKKARTTGAGKGKKPGKQPEPVLEDPEDYDGTVPLADFKHEETARNFVFGGKEMRGKQALAYQKAHGCGYDSARSNSSRLMGRHLLVADDSSEASRIARNIWKRINFLDQQYFSDEHVAGARIALTAMLERIVHPDISKYFPGGVPDVEALTRDNPEWLDWEIFPDKEGNPVAKFKNVDRKQALDVLVRLLLPVAHKQSLEVSGPGGGPIESSVKFSERELVEALAKLDRKAEELAAGEGGES